MNSLLRTFAVFRPLRSFLALVALLPLGGFTARAVVAPTVTTNAATNITATGATLNGTVNANGVSTSVSFQFGPTNGPAGTYGFSIAASPATVTGSSNTPVSALLSGLLPGATYHYRVVAGTANGLDQPFTVAAGVNYDFENIVSLAKTFTIAGQTWTLTGTQFKGEAINELGGPAPGTSTPESNHYADSTYGTDMGLGDIGGIKAPAGTVFRAASLDVWPSDTTGGSGGFVYGGGGVNGTPGTVGLKYTLTGYKNGIPLFSANVTDTLRTPPDNDPLNQGGFWHHIDLTGTTFASTDIDEIHIVNVAQTDSSHPITYLAIDNFTYSIGAPASLASVTPNSGQQGATIASVALVGTNTHFVQGTSVASFGAGITVNSTSVTDSTHATANITISAAATIAARDVTVTTSSEVVTLTSGFSVTAGTPVLASVTPNSGQQGATISSVALVGTFTHFVNGTSTAGFGAGITVNSTTVTDSTHATANISISAGATIGARNVTVTTGGEVVTLTSGFSVTAGTPVLTSVTPNSGQQGATLGSVALVGTFTHFVNATSTAGFGAGITVNSLVVTDSTHATANITISGAATIGTRDVTVTTGGEVVTLTSGFSVTAGTPVLASVTPNSGQQGATISSVALVGTFTHFVNGTSSTSFGAGITVNSTTVTDSTHATANITISGAATIGARDVTVTTGGEVVTLTSGFSVTAGTPVLASVTPNSGQQGATIASVALVGTFTHFVQGTSTAGFGAGVTVNSTTVTDATHATANITISGAATIGARNVTVTTGGEVATLTSGFSVTAGTPVLASATPNSGQQGATISSVALVGTFTHFVNGTSTAGFGAGVTVYSLTVTDSTHATANITIAGAATIGARNVTVTTGGEVVTLTSGFSVTAGTPVLASVTPNSGQQGATIASVALVGTFTHFVQGTSTADFGAGITVNSLTVSDSTHASANITIAAAATIGARDVTVTTGGEAVTLTSGFSVLEASSLIVTTTSDVVNNSDGLTSLREALAYAQLLGGTQTITFSNGTIGTISLSGGELAINSSVTVTGPGAALLTIDAHTASRVCNIGSGAYNVSFDGMTMANGKISGVVSGGGILNQSTGAVALTNCTLSGNSTAPLGTGGGIQNQGAGAVTITNSTLSGNSANTGGGIFNVSTGAVIVTNSTLSGNTADIGAGIYNNGTGAVTITESTLSSNSATNGNGGGINNQGGAVVLTNSTLSGNSAPAGNGGGLYNQNGAAALTNSTLSGNSANGGSGGGLYNQGGVLTLTNDTLSGNSASSAAAIFNSGAGSVTLKNTICLDGTSGTITDGGNNLTTGTAAQDGLGPLANNGGPTQTMALLGSSPAVDAGGTPAVSEVQLVNVSGGAGTFTLSFSGSPPTGSLAFNASATQVRTALEGLATIGTGNVTVLGASPAYLVVFSGTLGNADQPALITAGSGGATAAVTTLIDGGLLTTDQRGQARVVKGNAASASAVADIGAYELFAAPTVSNGALSVVTTGSPLDLTTAGVSPTGGTFSATGVPANTISGNNFNPAGVPLGVYTITYTVTDGTGASNSVTFTVTVTETPSLIVTTTSDTSTNIDGLTSLREALAYAATLPASPVPEITFNIPTSDPGYNAGTGVYTITLNGTELAINSSVTVTGPGAKVLTMSGNKASSVCNIGSGAFNVAFSGLTMANGTSSGVVGGGIVNDSTGTLSLTNCTVSGNTANVGGGIYNGSTGAIILTGCTLSGNDSNGGSGTGGGGIFNQGTGPITLTNCTLAGNTADQGAGLVNGGAGAVALTNCTLSGNVGSSGSSGIYNLSTGPVTLKNTICVDAITGTFTDGGNNITTGSAAQAGLDSAGLRDNGGPTQTIALVPGSPAIDAGDNTLAVDANNLPLLTDQRGQTRVVKGNAASAVATVDIGAFELFDAPTFATSALTALSGGSTINLATATGASPAGGTFSGTGVTGGVFDPTGVAPGVYTITYTVTDAFGVSNSATFTITVNAVVTPSAGAHGTISPNTVQTVTSGGSVSFTATPAAYYVVDQWLVNSVVAQTGKTSFTLSNITANATVQVTFKLNEKTDFNGDQGADVVLLDPSAWHTTILKLNGIVSAGTLVGPNLPRAWTLVDVADFDNDGHPDYLLFNRATGQTAIWYMNGGTFLGSLPGPTIPAGFEPVAAVDFDGDGQPDLLLANYTTRQTAVWPMLNNVAGKGTVSGPALPAGCMLAGAADFDGDGHPDLVLFRPKTRTVVIWYLTGAAGATYKRGGVGPVIPAGNMLAGIVDLNGDGTPDLLLVNEATNATTFLYLNNLASLGSAAGPTLPAGNFPIIPIPTPDTTDLNQDGYTDISSFNATTGVTTINYLIGGVSNGNVPGPVLATGWKLAAIADFDGDGIEDYALFNPTTRQTAISYLNAATPAAPPAGVSVRETKSGPTLQVGFELVAAGDFNQDGHPDFVLVNRTTGQTVVWFMNDNAFVDGATGPSVPTGFNLVGVADFDGDSNPDFVLYNPTTQATTIQYLAGTALSSSIAGPIIANGYKLAGVCDINGDGMPDLVLLRPATNGTTFWYMYNATFLRGGSGPTLPAGDTLVAP